MDSLNHRFKIGDMVYTVDEYMKEYPTGIKCSFCGVTSQLGKAKCNAAAWPYKCIRGEIHRLIPFFEAREHAISGVSVSKRLFGADKPIMDTSEMYWLDDMQRPYYIDDFFESYEQAAELARKNNELQLDLWT